MRPVFAERERRREKKKTEVRPGRTTNRAGIKEGARQNTSKYKRWGGEKIDIKDSAGLIIVMVPPMWTEAPSAPPGKCSISHFNN